MQQSRLGPDDVAIRHVEHIQVPEKECRAHHRERDSSEEDGRYRRRRRRRRSERKRQESLDDDDDSYEEASQDSNPRAQRKTSKSRTRSVGNRQSRSKKQEQKKNETDENSASPVEELSSKSKKDNHVDVKNSKIKFKNEHVESKPNKNGSPMKPDVTIVEPESSKKEDKAENMEIVPEIEVNQSIPEIIEPLAESLTNQPPFSDRESSLEENHEPVTVQVEAEVHYSHSEEQAEEAPESPVVDSPPEAEIILPPVEVPQVTVSSTPPHETVNLVSNEISEELNTLNNDSEMNDEAISDLLINASKPDEETVDFGEVMQPPPPSVPSLEDAGETCPRDVAFYKLDDSGTPGRRRSLTQADGSEIPDDLEERVAAPPRHRRQSLVFEESTNSDLVVKRTRRRSDVGVEKSARRGRRGSLFIKTESEEQEERAFRSGDIDTVIKNVHLGDAEQRFDCFFFFYTKPILS